MQNIGRMFKYDFRSDICRGVYFMHSRTYYVMACCSGVTLENLF